jgi:hypothetical protein
MEAANSRQCQVNEDKQCSYGVKEICYAKNPNPGKTSKLQRGMGTSLNKKQALQKTN